MSKKPTKAATGKQSRIGPTQFDHAEPDSSGEFTTQQKLSQAALHDSEERLRAILDYPGPLSTFAARTQVAFLCRLINGSVYSAIEALREIRNSVAHKPDEFVLADQKEKLQESTVSAPACQFGSIDSHVSFLGAPS